MVRQRGARANRGRPVGRGRVLAFGALTLAVLALAGYYLWPVVKPLGAGSPGAVTVQLSMNGFDPPRIVPKVGEPITLRLVNKDTPFHTDGGGWHQLGIDEFSIDLMVPPEKTREFTFTPTRSGNFEMYCDTCCGGRESPTMQGRLIVAS
ncbi:MAG: cupredoxin domain-containing protein [Chloroflexi bacterium]|nr:cupredoxin domain-containing protein [Chloroflexota bacterium]